MITDAAIPAELVLFRFAVTSMTSVLRYRKSFHKKHNIVNGHSSEYSNLMQINYRSGERNGSGRTLLPSELRTWRLPHTVGRELG